MATRRLQLWPKVLFAVFVGVWAPLVVRTYGWDNLLWLCDLANLLVLVGLVLESRLLLSSQLVAVLLVDVLWVVDVAWAAGTGSHPIGGTEYMFDPGIPALARASSLFHVFVPAVLLWALRALGYDRRALALQTAWTWAVLPVTFWLTTPERNVNWVFGPFGRVQDALAPAVYLAALMGAVPLVLYLPSHGVLCWLDRRFGRPG
jgi:hypothetical protein